MELWHGAGLSFALPGRHVGCSAYYWALLLGQIAA